MRKTALLILVLILATPLFAGGFFYFRGNTWGMDKQKVKENIKKILKQEAAENSGTLEAFDDVCAHRAKITFKFHKEKLYAIVMEFTPGEGSRVSTRRCILEGIVKRYGEEHYAATSNYYRWEREALKITADFSDENKYLVTYTDQDISEEILKEKERLLKERLAM
jgi:hypothetical protein